MDNFLIASKRSVYIFLTLGLFLASQPLLVLAQEVPAEGEYTISSEGTIQANSNYKDPTVQEIEAPMLGVNSSSAPLGTGVDPKEKLSPVDAISSEIKAPAKSLGELRMSATKSTPISETKIEYTAADGTKIVEQTPLPRNKQVGDKFEALNFKPTKVDGKLVHSSGKLNITYNTLTNGIKISTPAGDMKVKPKGVEAVEAVKEKDAVIYKGAWKNVDLVYEYQGDSIKEFIVIKKKNVTTTWDFKVEGAKVSNSPTVPGGIDIKIGTSSMYIEPLFVIATLIGPVSKNVVKQEAINDSTIRISLDSNWLNSLKDENFPVTIDPGEIWGVRPVSNSNRDYYSYKMPAYSCDYVYCDVNIGGLQDGGQAAWRSVVKMDFSELNDPKKTFRGAYIQMEMGTKPYRWNGFYDTNARINVAWASCFGFHCTPGTPLGYAHMTTHGYIDVSHLVQWMMDSGKWDGWFMFWGEENRPDTFKAFDAAYMKLNYGYNYKPNNNATVGYPVNNASVTNPAQILKINPATDPDGDPIEYNFVLSESNGTIVQQSGYSSSLTMPIADGVLQDGITYNWKVFVKDEFYGYPSTAPSVSSIFKVNFRTGKDQTQSYDSAGPVALNLATGNAYTANSSHSMNALGGQISVGLEYNSPQLTREGLSGRYFKNNSFTGEPVYSRIDPNIDYNWGTASPFKGIVPADNMSISWKGYFIAPVTGSYKFGTVADDNVWVYGNNSLLYNGGGTKWSTAVTLTEGQIWPIQVDYVEGSGNASIVLKIEMPDGTQKTMPSEYLRTAPVQTTQNRGLTGKYYFDSGNHDFTTNQQRFLMRTEPQINFDWGTGSPITGGPTDNFLVKYEGYVTAPISGDYHIGLSADDGFRVKLNGNTILEDWKNRPMGDKWTTNAITLNAGELNKIVIEYYEATGPSGIALKWKGPIASEGIIIENKYLSPDANVLPEGWELTLDGSGSIPFESLKVRSNNDVVMMTSDRTESVYTYTNGGYKPPVNQDAWLVKNADNTYTLTDVSGAIYIYDAMDNSGNYKLKESSTPFDDRNPAGLKYEYGSVGGNLRLLKIIDGADISRFGQLYYQGDAQCPVRTGELTAPIGYLCGFGTTDGRNTWFYYYQGLLTRIEYPGNAYFDYGYLNGGRLDALRDTSMIDAVEAGLRNLSDSGSRFQFNYDILGRIKSVGYPSATGISKVTHSFEYFPRASKQHLEGAPQPKGYSKYLEFDTLYRTTKLCNNMALCTTTEWDPVKDVLLSTTGPTGQKSTTIYDSDDKPIEAFGPAPSAWFGADRKPLAQYINQVPRVQTKYDEGLIGPAVAYYQVKGNTLFGSPKLHQFGINPNKAKIEFNSGNQSFPIAKATGMDGVGAAMTGKITFPQSGTYVFKGVHTDGLRIFVDDKLVVDNWSNRSATNVNKSGTFVAVANKVYRVRIDWLTISTTKYLSTTIAGPGITETNVWNQFIPGYNLVTANTVFDHEIGNVETKTNYSDPAYGLVSNKVLDSTGLNYSVNSSYEAFGTGYFRQLSKTTPGGSVTTNTYYGASQMVDNPCTAVVDPVSQAGFLKSKIEPDPDGAGSQSGYVSENVYNSTGTLIASRINSEAWNCFNYDARGRLVTKVIATNNGKTGKTITYNHAYGGNPQKKWTTDGLTSELSEYDFLGNLVKYTDASGSTTTYTYDSLSRLVKKSSAITGVEESIYNDYSQVIQKKIDQEVYATVTYDNFGRVATINYPKADQLAFLGTVRDALDREVKFNWRQSDGKLISEELTKSQSGIILNQKFTQDTLTYNQAYAYDKAARLVSANYGDMQFAYNYGAATNCTFATSNKNYNRTSDSTTVNGVTTTNNYCYDAADKLINSSQYGAPEYDAHGNTIVLGSLRFEYNILDMNTSVSDGTKTVKYTRDFAGRIIKTEYLPEGRVRIYGYSSSSDTPDFVKDATNVVTEKNFSLPGLQLTMVLTVQEVPEEPERPVKPGERWEETTEEDSREEIGGEVSTDRTIPLPKLPPIRKPEPVKTFVPSYSIMTSTGNVLANNTGAIKRYDPFGVQIGTANTLGFGGSELRETENLFAIKFIQMGKRVYIPSLGRFLQIDTIEGGTQNDYVYPNDPINTHDFNGEFFWFVVGIALVALEVVDWAITASDGVECAKGSTDSCVDAGTSVAFNLLPGPSLKLVGRIVDIVKPVTVAKTVDNIANARNLGKKGEEAVRASFNIGEKVRFIMPNGKLRIPDGFIPHHALSEVKNVKLLRLTSQIKDYATIAKNSNVKMVIYLRGTTALSPAMDAFRIQNGISLLRVL